MTIIGYDFDGVITHGVRPIPGRSVIITGRSWKQHRHTLDQMKALGVDCPVYFSPSPQNSSPEGAARWKAHLIEHIGISIFYEDDAMQAHMIEDLCPGVKVVLHDPKSRTVIPN